jgi:rRNA processing protein Gar1
LLRIGEVSHISKSHHLIIKSKTPTFIPLGSEIFNDNLEFMGSIVDVFGPTSSPYFSIKPVKESQKIIGKVVYAKDR